MWQKQQTYLTAQHNVKDMEGNLGDYTDLQRQAVYSALVQAQKISLRQNKNIKKVILLSTPQKRS